VKRLLIFRHAKSSWKQDAQPDHERPLNTRGKHAARLMGQWLAEQNAVPELILCSTAKRAKSTVQKAMQSMGYASEIYYDHSLYLASPSACCQAIRHYAHDQMRVMIVGHNPGLEELIQMMTGTERALPTAGLADIDLDINAWQDLEADTTGRLAHFWLPRELFS
jgi:phosphohistidine phosphatase